MGMGFLDNLVVGVDGSAASTMAFVWARKRVSLGGTIHAVSAVTSDSDFATTGQLDLQWDGDRVVEQAWTDEISGHSCTIATHLVEGDPTTVILEAAKEVDACAIVVGPHSSPLNRWTLGSVTRKLVQRGSVPLIVVMESGEFESTKTPAVRPVVSCIGYGSATEEAAMWAADYATEHNLPLSLLHVLSNRPLFPADSPSEMLASYLGSDVSLEWAAEDLKEVQLRVEERWPDLEIDAKVDFGAAVPAILAAGAKAELVVLGKRHWNAVLRAITSPRIHLLIAKIETAVAVVPSCSNEQ